MSQEKSSTEKYIGERKIKEVRETKEKTHSGIPLVEVQYEDGNTEWFSSKMFTVVVSDKPCDLSQLREKRIYPVVQEVLALLADWGIKTGDLSYLSTVLNTSLMENEKEALLELWSKWMPRPLSPDDVDLVTIDRVLRTIKEKQLTMKDIIGKPNDGSSASP